MPRTTLLRKQVTPTGSIQPLAGGTAPDGFLVCDGSIVNIADYPKLYAVIGTSWGHGNEISPGVSDGLTFHLPDLRGMFLRGKDDATGRDPDVGSRTAANAGGNVGDNVGSVQDDVNKNHHHDAGLWFENNNDHPVYGKITVTGGNRSTNAGLYGGNRGMRVRTSDDLSAPSTESRPKNVNVNYIIKAV